MDISTEYISVSLSVYLHTCLSASASIMCLVVSPFPVPYVSVCWINLISSGAKRAAGFVTANVLVRPETYLSPVGRFRETVLCPCLI